VLQAIRNETTAAASEFHSLVRALFLPYLNARPQLLMRRSRFAWSTTIFQNSTKSSPSCGTRAFTAAACAAAACAAAACAAAACAAAACAAAACAAAACAAAACAAGRRSRGSRHAGTFTKRACRGSRSSSVRCSCCTGCTTPTGPRFQSCFNRFYRTEITLT
jgi:hypothetical protein